jgi:Na+/melibiose symporter-like transporter
MSYFLSAFAASIPATLIIFYVRDYLMAESFLGYFLVVYFASGAISMPLWKFLSNRYSCSQAWLFSMILAITTFIWAYFIYPQDIISFFIICLFSGMAVGANLALPSSIIAEYIHINKHEEYAASYYSISNFLSKFSLAVAAGTALPLLGFMDYQPGLPRIDNLFPITYALIPCIIQAIAIFFTLRLIKYKNL